MADFKGLDYLKAKLQRKKLRVDVRYDYYDMKRQNEELMSSGGLWELWAGVAKR